MSSSSSSEQHPYAIFDKDSIKEGDYLSCPPAFTLYADAVTDCHQQQEEPRRRAASSSKFQNSSASDNNARNFRGTVRDRAMSDVRPPHASLQRSDGYNPNGPRNRQDNLPKRRNNCSISSSHDEVFRNNIPPGFFGPFNGRSFPTNNFGGPFVIPPFEGGFFPPTEGLPIYDFYHFPPLHTNQRPMEFVPSQMKGKWRHNHKEGQHLQPHQQKRHNWSESASAQTEEPSTATSASLPPPNVVAKAKAAGSSTEKQLSHDQQNRPNLKVTEAEKNAEVSSKATNILTG